MTTPSSKKDKKKKKKKFGSSGECYRTPNGLPILQIAFFEPNNSRNGNSECFNNLTSCITSEGGYAYTHCELRFSDGIVCSVTDRSVDSNGKERGGFVHYKKRELSNASYNKFVQFTLTQEQEDKMRARALEFYNARTPFNQAGMRLNFIAPFKWFPIDRGGSAVFCSELVTTLMKEVGFFKSLRPCTVSPTRLYWELKGLSITCENSWNWVSTGLDLKFNKLSLGSSKNKINPKNTNKNKKKKRDQNTFKQLK